MQICLRTNHSADLDRQQRGKTHQRLDALAVGSMDIVRDCLLMAEPQASALPVMDAVVAAQCQLVAAQCCCSCCFCWCFGFVVSVVVVVYESRAGAIVGC